MQAFRLMRAVAFASYKQATAFRSQMAVSILTGPVYFLIQFFIWSAVYSTRETVNGMTFGQILSYYGLAALINYLIFDSADWDVQDLVHSGKLVTFLLRPVSYRFYAFSAKTGNRLLAFLLELVPVYFIFYGVFHIHLVPKHPLWFLVSVTLSFLMTFLVNFCIGTCAFWLMRAHGVRRMFMLFKDFSAGVFVPLSFFPDVLQTLVFFLPFQFISYVPIQVFLGSYQLAGHAMSLPTIVGVQASAVLAMWGVAELLWRLGINKFTGVGT
ncbi:ABC transporter permease [Gorillibacterium sp. sgz5001074]|uniref:ABC transporter permease n=1 Tax=Gorillibacterium sp. sgz5001074 TaxID=3446695 RepID=UPI003F67F6C0